MSYIIAHFPFFVKLLLCVRCPILPLPLPWLHAVLLYHFLSGVLSITILKHFNYILVNWTRPKDQQVKILHMYLWLYRLTIIPSACVFNIKKSMPKNILTIFPNSFEGILLFMKNTRQKAATTASSSDSLADNGVCNQSLFQFYS